MASASKKRRGFAVIFRACSATVVVYRLPESSRLRFPSGWLCNVLDKIARKRDKWLKPCSFRRLIGLYYQSKLNITAKRARVPVLSAVVESRPGDSRKASKPLAN